MRTPPLRANTGLWGTPSSSWRKDDHHCQMCHQSQVHWGHTLVVQHPSYSAMMVAALLWWLLQCAATSAPQKASSKALMGLSYCWPQHIHGMLLEPCCYHRGHGNCSAGGCHDHSTITEASMTHDCGSMTVVFVTVAISWRLLWTSTIPETTGTMALWQKPPQLRNSYGMLLWPQHHCKKKYKGSWW